MADEPLEVQITRVQEEMAALRAELDAAAANYVTQAKAHLPAFFEKWMTRVVENQADVVQRLGLSGVKVIKQELKQFLESLPQVVDDAFPKPKEWWHHLPLPADVYETKHDVTYRGGEGVHARLRSIASPFGRILVRHGLAKQGYHQEWEGSPERPTYAYSMDLPKPISAAHSEYVEKFKTLVQKDRQLVSLEKRKTERDAKKLWDDA